MKDRDVVIIIIICIPNERVSRKTTAARVLFPINPGECIKAAAGEGGARVGRAFSSGARAACTRHTPATRP